MPSDRFLEYKQYVETLAANSKGKEAPATFDEWLHFPENELTDSTRNLELATALASGDGSRLHDVRAAGVAVLNDSGHQFTAYITALARSRIPRMTKMLTYCDNLEDKMMNNMAAENMSPAEVMRAYYLMGQTINSSLDLIKYVVDYSRGTPVDPTREFDVMQFGDKVGDGTYQAMLADKHDRDKLRNAVQILISGATPLLLNSGAAITPPPVVEAKKKPNAKVKKRR